MRKNHPPKSSQQSDGGSALSRDFPLAILDQASRDVSFEVTSVIVADSGAILLTGWIDDRSSKLHQVCIRGQAWSKTIDSKHIGRHRRADVEGDRATPQNRFFGFWILTVHDRALIDGNSCSVELVLANGTSKPSEVSIEFIAAEDLRARFARFWSALNDADRLPPLELSYLEQALKRPISSGVMPKHNIESIAIAEEGGVFINGWIDDTGDTLRWVQVGGNNGRVTFNNDALARTYRDDVQAAIATSRRHEFGFWGFAAKEAIQRGGNIANVDLAMVGGAQQRHDASIRIVDETELRDIVLTYLATSQHLGNPQLEAVAGLVNYIGAQIVDFNLKLSRKIVSQPYVERFGRRSRKLKGSIVVCLYGKPEYLFLQNSLFSNRPGIEDYEFVYVCNSPELVEPLLREAHITSSAYDIDQTLVILPGNAGFGAANNAAVKFAQTGRVLVVNPDVFPLDQDWAVKHTDIVEQLPREQTSIFGVPLYYDDGSLMHGGMYFDADRGVSIDRSVFKTMMFLRVEHYGKGSPPLATRFIKSRPVPAVTGAFMSFDRNWFENIGGFSEEFVFGHYEDADLCLKSLEKGISPWIHDVKLWHLEGKGSHRLPAHEGASIVNRWLFNKQWSEKVIPKLLGQSPNLSLPKFGQRSKFGQTMETIPLNRPRGVNGNFVNGTDVKPTKRPKTNREILTHNGGERVHSDTSGMELVFGRKQGNEPSGQTSSVSANGYE